MIIDNRQYFWKYNSVRDAFTDSTMEVIRKDFHTKYLKLILEENDVDGFIAVQAEQSETETEFLLACAAENPFNKGIIYSVQAEKDDYIELHSTKIKAHVLGTNATKIYNL